MGLIESAFWFPHNSKVFVTQADPVMLLCHILYAFWINFWANHCLFHFNSLYIITYFPLLRARIYISGIYYTQTKITDAQWQAGHNHEQLIKHRPKPQAVFSEDIDPRVRGTAKSWQLKRHFEGTSTSLAITTYTVLVSREVRGRRSSERALGYLQPALPPRTILRRMFSAAAAFWK